MKIAKKRKIVTIERERERASESESESESERDWFRLTSGCRRWAAGPEEEHLGGPSPSAA